MISIGVKIARTITGKIADVLLGEADRTPYESRTGTR